MVKHELEAIRLKLKTFIEINPVDEKLNEELDTSIAWIENALLRLEAREDGASDEWYEGTP